MIGHSGSLQWSLGPPATARHARRSQNEPGSTRDVSRSNVARNNGGCGTILGTCSGLFEFSYAINSVVPHRLEYLESPTEQCEIILFMITSNKLTKNT